MITNSTQALMPSVSEPAERSAIEDVRRRHPHFKPYFLLLVSSILLSLTVALVSWKIEATYLSSHPHFFDPVAYDLKNINLYEEVRTKGPFAPALGELIHNHRFPGRTVPLVLFAPQLLAKPFCHLYTETPALCSFLFLLGLLAYRRTSSIVYSVAAMSIASAVPGLLNPNFGFGANWLDLPAALYMGAAALCLILFRDSPGLGWLAGFGILASISVMSRFSAAFYLAPYAIPTLAWLLYKNQKRVGSITEGVLKPLGVVSATTAVAACFLLNSLSYNVSYYQTYGYGLGSTIEKAISALWSTLVMYFSVPYLCILATVFLGNTLWLVTRPRKTIVDLDKAIISIWLPVSVLGFLLSVKFSGGVHPFLYLVPAILVAALTGEMFANWKSKWMSAVSVVLFVFAAATFVGTYNLAYKASKSPSQLERIRKVVDVELGNYLGRSKSSTCEEFDDESVAPLVESYYATGWLPSTPPRPYFSIHQSYWKGWYPGLTPEQVAQKAYGLANEDTNVVLIHANIDDIRKSPLIDNPFSLAVSSYMTQHVPSARNWKLIKTIPGPNGTLAMYENCRLKSTPTTPTNKSIQ